LNSYLCVFEDKAGSGGARWAQRAQWTSHLRVYVVGAVSRERLVFVSWFHSEVLYLFGLVSFRVGGGVVAGVGGTSWPSGAGQGWLQGAEGASAQDALSVISGLAVPDPLTVV
jgi:hypothetical protein